MGYIHGRINEAMQHYEYDPLGNIVAQTGTLQQSYQWSSKEADAGTGLVYYLYRFYSPTLGRWTNRDPVGERGGFNRYCFASNAPGNFMDPSGHQAEEIPEVEPTEPDFYVVPGEPDNIIPFRLPLPDSFEEFPAVLIPLDQILTRRTFLIPIQGILVSKGNRIMASRYGQQFIARLPGVTVESFSCLPSGT